MSGLQVVSASAVLNATMNTSGRLFEYAIEVKGNDAASIFFLIFFFEFLFQNPIQPSR